MKNSHPSVRPGFTLIELLIVILIIGLISSLLLVAVMAGLRRAQEAAVSTEIEQLAVAVESFKNDKGTYPLSFGFRLTDNRADTEAAIGQRMLRTFSKVFPRYAPGGAGDLVLDVSAGSMYLFPQGQSSDSGLSLFNLDPAESLVFWLGGMPDPNSETKLISFRTDPASPFRYTLDPMNPLNPQYLAGRKPTSYFQFDPTRLVDRDGDGWLEYIPKGTPSSGLEMPPYVYFDGTGYADWPAYPNPNAFGSGNSAIWGTPILATGAVRIWGTAIPYARDESARGVNNTTDPPTPTPKIQWMNSQKFQIIAPGRDGSYGGELDPALNYFTGSTNLTTANLCRELRMLPSCQRLYPVTSPAEQTQFDLQLDNQTNFTTGKVGDDRP